MTFTLPTLWLLFASSLALAAPAEVGLSLPDALKQARAHSPWLRAKVARVEGARSMTTAASSALLPHFRIEASVQLWDRPLDIRFVNSQTLPDPSSLPPTLAPVLQSLAAPFRARNQVTGNFVATLAQPLVSLYPLWLARELKQQEVAASQGEHDAVGQQLAFSVIEAYVRALSADEQLRVAVEAEAVAARFVTRARAVAEAGLIAQTDVQKAVAAHAQSKERVIGAEALGELAHAALSTLLGSEQRHALLHSKKATRFVPPSLDAGRAQQRRDRFEWKTVQVRHEQTRTLVSLARARLLPELNLVGQYSYTEGNRFAQTHQVFAGAVLSWDIFEFGNKWFQVDAAHAQEGEAEAEAQRLAEGLSLELQQAITKWRMLEAGVSAADESFAAAKLVHDNEESRFAAGQVTATELALAQTARAQAEVQASVLRWQAVAAEAEVRKALGEDLWTFGADGL